MSHAEFFRVVPAALSPMHFERSGLCVVAGEGGQVVRLEVSDERPLRLGALTLPSITVTLRSEGYGDVDWNRFLARFHRVFHRGGG